MLKSLANLWVAGTHQNGKDLYSSAFKMTDHEES